MPHDTEALQRCRILVEKKLSWRPAEEWRDYEFTELSEKIFEAAGVQLSATTLKRVFGKIKYKSLPSSVTLNALAKYVGYENWMQFKSHQIFDKDEREETPVPSAGKKNDRYFTKKALAAALTILVLILIFGFVFLSGPASSSSQGSGTKNVVFKSKPLTEGLPNSVVFNVDLQGMMADDVIIQQSWDSTKTIKLKPGQTEATGIYYTPGYFRAKLIVNGEVIKEHDLFIRSNEWMATIDHIPVPDYLEKDELVLNKKMTVSPAVLNELKKLDKPVTLSYHLVKPFPNLHSDNFTLETSFQNIYSEGPAVCKTTKLFILCTNSAFIIPFAIPGCVSDINLKLQDKYFDGKSNDLSVFGTDPSQPVQLKVEVKNRLVKIFCNGKLLREEKYNADGGDIAGIRYSFLGAGAVDNIILKNEKEEIVYKNEFR